MDYRKSDFYYELPEELIARYPLAERSASRLLLAAGAHCRDLTMRDFPELLAPNDLLIFNNTKVMAARLLGQKDSGGRAEILVERILSPTEALAQVGASKRPRPGTAILIDGQPVQVLAKEGDLYRLQTAHWPQLLAESGQLPIPPYFHRPAEELDEQRYQTIFAKELGAVAAPTAGLHFDADLLAALDKKGVKRAELTLHVGAGTFQPVRVEDLSAHHMHSEFYSIAPATLAAIEECKRAGGRVIAIGTTSLRALESAFRRNPPEAAGDTDIFIKPPHQFAVVDGLFTNFHLPESTLIMLVSAFLGFENTRHAYAHAIAQRYRFFSYGDAMFIPQFYGE